MHGWTEWDAAIFERERNVEHTLREILSALSRS